MRITYQKKVLVRLKKIQAKDVKINLNNPEAKQSSRVVKGALHSKSLVQQIGNYTPADLTNMYKKYKYKRPKHRMLKFANGKSQCFFKNFSLPLFTLIIIFTRKY
jgi:hypothetical protein